MRILCSGESSQESGPPMAASGAKRGKQRLEDCTQPMCFRQPLGKQVPVAEWAACQHSAKHSPVLHALEYGRNCNSGKAHSTMSVMARACQASQHPTQNSTWQGTVLAPVCILPPLFLSLSSSPFHAFSPSSYSLLLNCSISEG